ncbi:F-box domain-containing protein [Mycena kentingensis (nom. inval.)]|nr:F-box domain-containing protein [Mycena kentingensis (nom. inval.)]
MATISDFPPEILEQIFAFLVPEHGWPTPDPKLAPMLLCGVCATWRGVALSMPQFWSSLHVPEHAPHVAENWIPLSRGWLARASGRPISLSLQNTHSLLELPITEFYRGLNVVRLRLFDPSHASFETLFSDPPPRLSSLHIYKPHPYSAWCPPLGWNKTLALDEFIVSGSYKPPPIHLLPIAWAGLTRLHLGQSGTFTMLCMLVARCTALESLYFRILDNNAGRELSTPAHTLPRLTTLTIIGSNEFAAFLSTFAMPALTSLTLGSSTGKAISPPAALRALHGLGYLAPSLARLSMEIVLEPELHFPALDRFPHLADLCVCFDADFLQALVDSPQHLSNLPRLGLVHDSRDSEPATGALKELTRARPELRVDVIANLNSCEKV